MPPFVIHTHFRAGYVCKTCLDRLAALVLVTLTAPVQLAVALLVLARLGRPVWFRQERLGLNVRPFCMIKFRTMTDARDSAGALLPDEQRLIPLGKLLRSTSLDELPELWHVLFGQMSLVGPRPLPSIYRDRYSKRQNRRHRVRPGITGWAQIQGRNQINWEQRLEMDVWYVEHWSFWLDCRILWRTLRVVFRRDGISAADGATMPEFRGRLSSDNHHL